MRRAFTLLELLVVVAIIALLIAILIPALSRARELARRSATLANLHAIGRACAAYQEFFDRARPTDLTAANADGRSFRGFAILAKWDGFSPKLLINPNTEDRPAVRKNAAGEWVLIELAGEEVTLDAPATIDARNIQQVAWHLSFAYDHDPKKLPHPDAVQIFMADRADYTTGRSFSGNWGGRRQCALYTDFHAEFVTTNAAPSQGDPNIYHHNEYGGEGAGEVNNGVKVGPQTIDTHLRVFSEAEDDALLPN